MMADKGQTQTTTQNTAPWVEAQPAVSHSIDAARALWEANVGSQPFTGSTVVPFSTQTQSGLNLSEQAANTNAPALNNQFNTVSQNAAQGGLNELQQQSVDALSPMAQGDYLTRNNPFTEAVVNRSADLIGNQVGEMASSQGRFGSGAHQGILADRIGAMANQAYQGDYNRERGFQQDAIGSLFNAGQTQQGNINANTGALQDAYDSSLAPARTMMGVGGQYDDLATREINDELRLFNEQQNRPWENLARLSAIAQGGGALGSSTTNYAQGPSRMQQGLGGALAGSSFGPWGTALGGLGGMLF